MRPRQQWRGRFLWTASRGRNRCKFWQVSKAKTLSQPLTTSLSDGRGKSLAAGLSFYVLLLASGHLGEEPAAVMSVWAQPAKPFASVLSYRGAGRQGLRQCAESYLFVNAVRGVVHVVIFCGCGCGVFFQAKRLVRGPMYFLGLPRWHLPFPL
jgi:hypothetical protein